MRISLVGCLNFGLVRGKVGLKPYVPLGLLNVASIAEALGHTVEFIDVNRLPAQLGIAYDKSFIAAAAAFIQSTHPDLVGFASISNSFVHTIRMARALEPHVPVVLGGPQATAVDREVMEAFPCIDAVLRGEVEQSLAGFLAWVAGQGSPAQVQGMTYREQGQVVRTPDSPPVQDLDALLPPAYHLLPTDGFDILPIEAGRGCPYNCTFCSTSVYFKRRHRVKSVSRLVHEMEQLSAETGCRYFEFVHDLFTANRAWVVEFCDEVLRHRVQSTWRCSARVDRVDREMLDLMQRAGCRELFFGVESGSTRMQKLIRKNLGVDAILQTLGYARQIGISPAASFIIGFPEETAQDIQDTSRVATGLIRTGVTDVRINVLHPLPGSPLMDMYGDRLALHKVVTKTGLDALQAEDWELVERFPRIFSHAYYFPLQHITPEAFRWIHVRMTLAVWFLSTLVTMRERLLHGLWKLVSPLVTRMSERKSHA